LFATVYEPFALNVVPLPIVKTPVPSGPATTVAPAVVGLLFDPITTPPACTFTPPPNVLEIALPDKSNNPFPVFTKPVVVLPVLSYTIVLTCNVGVAFAICVFPFTVTGATFNVKFDPFKFNPPPVVELIAAMFPTLLDVALTVPLLICNVPPAANV
jgi:hypothetical protein